MLAMRVGAITLLFLGRKSYPLKTRIITGFFATAQRLNKYYRWTNSVFKV